MPFLDLERDIAADFEEAAGGYREWFGHGFAVTARRNFDRPKTLRRPVGTPEAVRKFSPQAHGAGFESRGTPHDIRDELVGSTWGDEASLEAQRRRR